MMKLRKIYVFLLLAGLPLLVWNYPIAIGWMIGQLVMTILVTARTAFYEKILVGSNFKMNQYVSYVLFTIALIAGPLLFSFFFRELIEPLAVFAAYFVSRILTFLVNLFSKEKTYNAS